MITTFATDRSIVRKSRLRIHKTHTPSRAAVPVARASLSLSLSSSRKSLVESSPHVQGPIWTAVSHGPHYIDPSFRYIVSDACLDARAQNSTRASTQDAARARERAHRGQHERRAASQMEKRDSTYTLMTYMFLHTHSRARSLLRRRTRASVSLLSISTLPRPYILKRARDLRDPRTRARPPTRNIDQRIPCRRSRARATGQRLTHGLNALPTDRYRRGFFGASPELAVERGSPTRNLKLQTASAFAQGSIAIASLFGRRSKVPGKHVGAHLESEFGYL